MNKQLVRDFVEEVWNRGNLEAGATFLSADFVNHSPAPGEAPGIEGLRQRVTMDHTAFHDFHEVIEDLIAEGDRVVARIRWSGTHTGPLQSIAPTGKRVSGGGINIFRIVDGKLLERWGEMDRWGLMKQLGVAVGLDAGPPPTSGP